MSSASSACDLIQSGFEDSHSRFEQEVLGRTNEFYSLSSVSIYTFYKR
jgi:hypothetical protein